MNSIFSAAMSTTHIIELFGLLLDGSDAMFGLKDLDHRYIFANRQTEISFRIAPGSLIGKTIGEFMTIEDAERIREKEESVMASGKPARFSESFHVGAVKIDCVTIRFPVRDGNGRIIGVGFVGMNSGDQNPGVMGMQDALESSQKTIGELQQLLQEMKLQATTDALTGVWNRRQIEESVSLEMARMDRYSYPFSVVFLDLDHFKRVNDTFGHTVGDQVLTEFCKAITGSKRTSDMLGRWGGEEFLMVLPNTGRSSARLLAERMRAVVSQHVFPGVGHITASFGVATVKADDTTNDLIERADAALYAAKQQGRNRVETDLPDTMSESESEIFSMDFVRLVWRQAYECGHPLIDMQHQKLFEDANSLLEGVLDGRSKEEVTQLIDVLLQDVVQHFGDEEAVFRAVGFPDADEHGRVHANLVAKALDLSVRNAADKLTLGELFDYLAIDVIARHLLTEDRKFFSYLGNTAW